MVATHPIWIAARRPHTGHVHALDGLHTQRAGSRVSFPKLHAEGTGARFRPIARLFTGQAVTGSSETLCLRLNMFEETVRNKSRLDALLETCALVEIPYAFSL